MEEIYVALRYNLSSIFWPTSSHFTYSSPSETGQPHWRGMVACCIRPRTWRVTAPSWEGASRRSLHFQRNLTLHRASSPTCLIHCLKQVVVSTKTSANPNSWHNVFLLQVGKALTHIPWARGPTLMPFTNRCILNPQRGGQVAQPRGRAAPPPPPPTPHWATKVRGWELALLGRIWANTDRQTFHERRHAAFNLMAASTHREYLSGCPFSGTVWHAGVPRGCPEG